MNNNKETLKKEGDAKSSVQLKSINFLQDFDTNYQDTDNNKSDASKQSSKYTIYWDNLTYQVYRASVDKLIDKIKRTSPRPNDVRTILKDISGSFSSGQMTALMGPSGAGKTTLLECLIDKRRIGLSGEIKVKRFNSDTKINLALVPQKSEFFECFTVFETIRYSSQLKSSNITDGTYHDDVTQSIIQRLDLELVSSSAVKSLSGSERKRLAIGIEIVSQPNLLVLDEPTTGLDSFAAQKVVNLLYSISREGVGVIMTIHQPSWNIFRMFDKIYMLSPIVQRCIYQGPPTKIIPYLETKGLVPIEGITPPDYITDVASAIINDDNSVIDVRNKIDARSILISMADDADKLIKEEIFSRNKLLDARSNLDAENDSDAKRDAKTDLDANLLSSFAKVGNDNLLASFMILLKRELLISTRCFERFWVILFTGILVPLIMFFQMGGYVTNYLGCPISMQAIPNEMNVTLYVEYLSSLYDEIYHMWIARQLPVVFPMGAAFIGCFFPMFFYQGDLKIIWREFKNSSYNVNCYIAAKIISDFICITIMNTVFTSFSYTLLGGNTNDVWRFFLNLLGFMIISTLYNGVAIVLAVLCRNGPVSTTVFITTFFMFPHICFANYLVAPERALDAYTIFSWLFFYRYSYDILLLANGGFDACGIDVRSRVVAIVNVINKWIYSSMSLTDVNGYSMAGNFTFNLNTSSYSEYMSSIDEYNMKRFQDISSYITSNITSTMETIERLGNIFARDATKYFISSDGQVRAAYVAYEFDLIDSDLGRMLTVGFIQIVIYMIASYFALKFAIFETF